LRSFFYKHSSEQAKKQLNGRHAFFTGVENKTKTKKMKTQSTINLRTVLVLWAVLIGGVAAYAQEQQTGSETALTPKFGIKGGINLANLYTSDVQDENLKVGVNAGFFAKLPIVKGISIQPELLYSSKGAKDTYNNFVQGSGEYRFNLNYIETPLLMVFNITPNFNVNGGAYAAYLASANVKDMKSDGTIEGVRELNAENFHRLDYGLVGGLGVDVGNITFGARYSYGLAKIGQEGSLSGDLTKNSKNSVATLFIGFGF
jgi:Outer membrane protein beta-barrel domain